MHVSIVERNDNKEGKLCLNGHVRLYQYSNHYFTRCILFEFRQEGCLSAFVSVCSCGNEKIVQTLKQNRSVDPSAFLQDRWKKIDSSTL